ncbi:MAG: inositol monophosphatase family protein [candidate division WOR-3 bacterium]
MDNRDKLNFLIYLAKKAGVILLRLFRKDFEIENKKGAELLTTADKKSENFIIEALSKKYPKIEIIAEETKPNNWDVEEAFIIDPLDGTNNFSFGIPIFSVSIAYQLEGKLKIGVVYDPIHKELFHATKDGGAFLNGKPIRVSERLKLEESILATGFPYIKIREEDSNIPEFNALLMKSRCIRRLGSAALDLCYVACGRFDGYWEKHLKIWDISAGGLIVEEAGGKVTNFYKESWNYKNSDIIASNGKIHDKMKEIIERVRNEKTFLA